MILVHTPEHSFYIDPYETSELAPGDYFSIRNQMPLINVSAQEAEQICKQQSKRLCNIYEWTNACLGTHRFRYSYGQSYKETNCNAQTDAIARTGARSECHNDTGLHDMIGNAMEWVRDSRSGMVVAKGGSYITGAEADCFTTFYFPPEIRHNQIGFRCCHSAAESRTRPGNTRNITPPASDTTEENRDDTSEQMDAPESAQPDESANDNPIDGGENTTTENNESSIDNDQGDNQ
ncbi:MAG: SUMF1/EgtB/PvdO family nonheme iron enzyme [Leptospiraceae bacterium]|nr:SUMF1/EgtB/PvdO family nonheme iron enzyme [Leptospiraceae bacterium]